MLNHFLIEFYIRNISFLFIMPGPCNTFLINLKESKAIVEAEDPVDGWTEVWIQHIESTSL